MFREEISEIRKDIVNFHGEMVLLVNYSNINYTGELPNILKKKSFKSDTEKILL